MNARDRHPDYTAIYREVVRLFRRVPLLSSGALDETYYTMRVYETCKDVMKLLRKPCDRQQVMVAALLHDIGKIKLDLRNVCGRRGFIKNAHLEWGRHQQLGVQPARRILTRMGHSEEFIDGVCFLVGNHFNKGLNDKPVELQVLQDADLIADCGIAGFMRPFLYSGYFRLPTVGNIMFIQNHPHRIKDLRQLNLDVSKKLARRSINLEKTLVRKAVDSIASDVVPNVFKLP